MVVKDSRQATCIRRLRATSMTNLLVRRVGLRGLEPLTSSLSAVPVGVRTRVRCADAAAVASRQLGARLVKPGRVDVNLDVTLSVLMGGATASYKARSSLASGSPELSTRTAVEVSPAPVPLESEPQPLTNVSDGFRTRHSARQAGSGAPIELDLVVPPSGNMWLRRQQFWPGPARAGQVVRFWIDWEWVHLSIGGGRVSRCARGSARTTSTPWWPRAPLQRGRRRWPRVVDPGQWCRPHGVRGRAHGRQERDGLAGCAHGAGGVDVGRSAGGDLSRRRLSGCSSTPARVSCCGPGPTRCSPARPRRCSAVVRPVRCPDRRLSRSPCSGGPPTPAC